MLSMQEHLNKVAIPFSLVSVYWKLLLIYINLIASTYFYYGNFHTYN